MRKRRLDLKGSSMAAILATPCVVFAASSSLSYSYVLCSCTYVHLFYLLVHESEPRVRIRFLTHCIVVYLHISESLVRGRYLFFQRHTVVLLTTATQLQSTMQLSILLSTVLATLTSAHVVLTYPGTRGNNLVQNDTWPYGMQWSYPCTSSPSFCSVAGPFARNHLTSQSAIGMLTLRLL